MLALTNMSYLNVKGILYHNDYNVSDDYFSVFDDDYIDCYFDLQYQRYDDIIVFEDIESYPIFFTKNMRCSIFFPL